MKQIARRGGAVDRLGQGNLEDNLRHVSSGDGDALRGLLNALQHVENNTGDTSKAAAALSRVIQKKVNGHELDEVVPIVPKVLGQFVRHVPTDYDSFSKKDVGDILAASVLGLDRAVIDRAFRGLSPISAASSSPGALRQLISVNLKTVLDSLGYDANLTNLYEPVALSASLPSSVSAAGADGGLPVKYETSLTAFQIQHMLKDVLDSDTRVDGIFDDSTTESVRVFQNLYGLVPDGIVGPATSAALVSIFGNGGSES